MCPARLYWPSISASDCLNHAHTCRAQGGASGELSDRPRCRHLTPSCVLHIAHVCVSSMLRLMGRSCMFSFLKEGRRAPQRLDRSDGARTDWRGQGSIAAASTITCRPPFMGGAAAAEPRRVKCSLLCQAIRTHLPRSRSQTARVRLGETQRQAEHCELHVATALGGRLRWRSTPCSYETGGAAMFAGGGGWACVGRVCLLRWERLCVDMNMYCTAVARILPCVLRLLADRWLDGVSAFYPLVIVFLNDSFRRTAQAFGWLRKCTPST
jgi:hypothetical protein